MSRTPRSLVLSCVFLLAASLLACGKGSSGADGGVPDGGTPDAGSGVTGSQVQHFYNQGTVTPKPVDLSHAPIRAWVPDASADGGFDFYPGTGTAQGQFTVPGVPASATYLLTLDGVYWIASNQRSVDFGFDTLGRADRQVPDAGTLLEVDAGNMSPWQANEDGIELVIEGAGLTNEIDGATGSSFVFPSGATQLSTEFDYAALVPAFNNSLIQPSDQIYISHLEGMATASNSELASQVVLAEFFSTSGLTMVNGGTSVVEGNFVKLPLSQPFSGTYPRAALAGRNVAVHPAAHLYSLNFALSSNSSGTRIIDFSPATLFSAEVDTAGPDGGTYDVPVTAQFGSPFPSGWATLASSTAAYAVRLQTVGIDGGMVSTSVTALNGDIDTLTGAALTGLKARMGPVQQAKLNGAPLTSDASGIGLTPTLTWSPPLEGPATFYSVQVHHWDPTTRTRFVVGNLNTQDTQLQLPPGILVPGQIYLMELVAFLNPNNPFAAGPLYTNTPVSFSTALSGVLRP